MSARVANTHKARQVGLEPTTSRLTAGCSTIELLPNCGPTRLQRKGAGQSTPGRPTVKAIRQTPLRYELPQGSRRADARRPCPIILACYLRSADRRGPRGSGRCPGGSRPSGWSSRPSAPSRGNRIARGRRSRPAARRRRTACRPARPGGSPTRHADAAPQLRRAAVRDGPRVEQRHLDVEDQVHQRDDVEAQVELHPARADARLAALVDRRLLRVGHLRPGERADDEVEQHERRPERHEERDRQQDFHRRTNLRPGARLVKNPAAPPDASPRLKIPSFHHPAAPPNHRQSGPWRAKPCNGVFSRSSPITNRQKPSHPQPLTIPKRATAAPFLTAPSPRIAIRGLGAAVAFSHRPGRFFALDCSPRPRRAKPFETRSDRLTRSILRRQRGGFRTPWAPARSGGGTGEAP